MDKSDLANEWFTIADMDLASAKFLLNMHPVPKEIICYHCQQSAEKYLKGFLIFSGHQIVKTHDLVLLNKICQKYLIDCKQIEESCFVLTNYSVSVRYPFPIDINENDIKTALDHAHSIQEFIKSKIEEKKN